MPRFFRERGGANHKGHQFEGGQDLKSTGATLRLKRLKGAICLLPFGGPFAVPRTPPTMAASHPSRIYERKIFSGSFISTITKHRPRVSGQDDFAGFLRKWLHSVWPTWSTIVVSSPGLVGVSRVADNGLNNWLPPWPLFAVSRAYIAWRSSVKGWWKRWNLAFWPSFGVARCT